MEAASRESFAAARERLDALSRGRRSKAKTDRLYRVADELLSVARLLAGQPRLRRALADPARPGEQRAELVSALLSGKVSDQTLEVLGTLATGRWSSARDLLDGVELAGVEALLASAESDASLADVEDALFRFGQVVAGEPRLAAVLGDPAAAPERRVELVRGLLADKVTAVTQRLVELAMAGFGGRAFEASIARLVELAAQRRDRQVAYVTVAAPLPQDDEDRLAAALGRIYGREVSLKVSVVPEVLGGMSVQVGHELYDGTILRRLTDARAALAR
jgi:F-type H+-transporting ATPase subunit delta